MAVNVGRDQPAGLVEAIQVSWLAWNEGAQLRAAEQGGGGLGSCADCAGECAVCVEPEVGDGCIEREDAAGEGVLALSEVIG